MRLDPSESLHIPAAGDRLRVGAAEGGAGWPLRPARVHEAAGAAATTFALAAAAAVEGEVLWILPSWQRDRPMLQGVADFLCPSRLVFAFVGDAAGILAVMEEGLRAHAVGLVVAEVPQPIGLTAGRRLQLAAEAGRTPGLCLIAEGAGSHAAETRWHCQPVFAAEGGMAMHWRLVKNKSGTIGLWNVRWERRTHRLAVISAPGRPRDSVPLPVAAEAASGAEG